MARSRPKGNKPPTKGAKSSAKAGGGDDAAPTLLSPELMAELGDGSGGAMVTTKANDGNKKRGRVVSSETRELAATISKSKAKKLKQLEDKKLKDGRRAELYLKLEKNRMSQNQLSLLQSSKTISMNQDTLKSRIKQAVQKAVAGIALSAAVINELESHPEAVADTEEALALPVGGALAAARRSSGITNTRGNERGEGGGSTAAGTPNGKERCGEKAAAEDKSCSPSGSDKAGVAEGVGAAEDSTGEKAAAAVLLNKKRSRYVAMPVATPKPKKRIQVVSAKSSKRSSSCDNSDSSDGSESMSKLNPSASSKKRKATISASVATKTTPSDEGAAAATDTEDEPATTSTSASGWAAKMMSSVSRLPTSGSALSSDTVTGRNQQSAGAVDAGEDDAEGDTADTAGRKGSTAVGSVGASDNNGHAESNESAAADAPSAAVASYPPPPTWLKDNSPVYHAVEKRLPSVSGDGKYGPATRGGGGAASLFPRPARWVPVKRPVELQAARMQLPVCGMEQEITEAVHDHDTIILCGETGSGKSTQVPQFLYEAGYAAHGLIGVTQPRRVAAVGTAERVAFELGTKCGKGGAVAYQIRYDASGVGKKTKVKFMTDGVLLQEITSDLLLRKYSVVLLDEAHERNLNTDVLLGMISRSIPLRKQVAQEEQRSWDMLSEESKKNAKLPLRPLKLVIMSATLRVSDFTENKALFPLPPPVISATSRQHPVTVHFSKRTELFDYVGEAFRKVCKIHHRLPEGGILVFLTGKREILHVCDKLRREFSPPKPSAAAKRGGQESGGSSGRRSEGGGVSDGAKHRGAGAAANEGGTGVEQEEAEGEQGRARTQDDRGNAEKKGKGSVEAKAATKPREDKPRRADREALLYREADDDEEDAARLGDMEEHELEGGEGADKGDAAPATALAGNLAGGEGADDDNDVGEGGLSSGSEAEDEDNTGALSKMGCFGDDENGGSGGAGQALPPVHVVPLYAMLTAEEQATVFRPPPEGHRLIVVATNVAETSITIPGIAYVVDCGRQKRRVVQRGSGISQFEVGWVSKASADQRAGRAGRTGPGHCYRLYSSALYTQTLEAFAPPEVLTRPLEDVMLQMKAMGIVDVSRFPFPTAPDASGLRSAAALLANLGATAGRGNAGLDGGEITAVGKALALLPVGARYAKMLLLAVQGGLLAHATALVAMLTEGDPFVRPDSAVREDGDGGEGADKDHGEDVGMCGGGDAEEVRRRRAQWMHPTSDALARLKAAGAYAYATSGGTVAGGGDFCRENYLHGPTMDRSLQLRRQLSRLVDLRFGTEPAWRDCDVAGMLRPPTLRQSDALRQVLLSGLLDNVARRAPAGTVKAGSKLFRECAYLSCNEAVTEPLYIKSTSVLFSRDPLELPEWVVYQDIVRGEREGAAAHMTCVTAIEAGWIPALAEGSPLLFFSDPLVSPPPTYDSDKTHAVMCRVTPRYGVHAWELPPHLTELASAAPKNRPDTVFRWFGRLLLEGGVGGCLSELKREELLNDPPSLLTREKPTKKVATLVLELRQKNVCSLPALVQQWQKDPTYLKSAVGMWVKLGYKQGFEKVWPNAIRTAVAALRASAPSGARGGGDGVGVAAGVRVENEEREADQKSKKA